MSRLQVPTLIVHDRDDRMSPLAASRRLAGHAPSARLVVTESLGHLRLLQHAGVAETVVRRRTESEWINGQNLFAQDESTPMNSRRAAGNEVGSPHPGGASLAFCDGHVEFVHDSIEQPALNAMLTKAGGE